jgi:dTDP-4-dehydrorhamnose 3,5-epimerase
MPTYTDTVQINDRAKASFSVQDYSGTKTIEGVEIVQLRRFNDDGGSMTELGRLMQGQHKQLAGFEVKQVNYSTMEPGVIKAYHMHHRQTDVWFVPPHDKMLLVLHDARNGSASEGVTMRRVLGDGNSHLVRIPPGVAHGVCNISQHQARIIYFVDVQFSPDHKECDEGRLPWDYLGADIWQIQRG